MCLLRDELSKQCHIPDLSYHWLINHPRFRHLYLPTFQHEQHYSLLVRASLRLACLEVRVLSKEFIIWTVLVLLTFLQTSMFIRHHNRASSPMWSYCFRCSYLFMLNCTLIKVVECFLVQCPYQMLPLVPIYYLLNVLPWIGWV